MAARSARSTTGGAPALRALGRWRPVRLPARRGGAEAAAVALSALKVTACRHPARKRRPDVRRPRAPNARVNARRRLFVNDDPQTGAAPAGAEATMCVRDADDRCVLQFTLRNAAGCALHRRASRVIHRSELCVASTGRCGFCIARQSRGRQCQRQDEPC